MRAGQTLDGVLAAHGFFFCIEILDVNEFDGRAGAGVLAALAAVVGSQPPADVVGPARVQGSIGTFQNVGAVALL